MQSNLKAKRHPLLNDLSTELRGFRIAETFEVVGHKYRLQLLAPSEMDWVIEKATSGANLVEMANLMSRPLIAAALLEIDNIPVAQLFQLPDDLPKEARQALEADSKVLAEWRREQIFAYLGEDVDVEVIKELGKHYTELEDRKRKQIGEIRNLSKGTLSRG